MGRGRAPCCDKSQVVRGPWSPAEDHRLISYIQKYGHDNWRSLPKQAGLLRCGKSCRLRWINYLRPDLKRGNFSKKEEESIIQLHQTIGNKWSRIAAHFPGRTDNEIKNVWNTHLKKRLTKKVVEANNKQDETSVITSSSSSSTTAESSPKNHKTEIQSQIKLLPCEGSQAKTDEMIFAPNQSIAPQHQDSESLGASIDQQPDSTHINQLVQFTVWEDPNLLESLLSAVDDLEWVLAPQLDSSRDLHMESDIDLWSMLNNDDQPAPSKPVDKEAEQVYTVEAPMTENNINADAYITDKDIDIMFEYLDNEPGLSMEMYQGDDLNRCSPTAAATGNGIPSMDYFPIWPQSQT